jgi:hypothetical protein
MAYLERVVEGQALAARAVNPLHNGLPSGLLIHGQVPATAPPITIIMCAGPDVA